MTDEMRDLLTLLPPLPWHWQQGRLIGGDGTTILWTVTDVNGEQYIGAQADCELFISAAPKYVRDLIHENEPLKAENARLQHIADSAEATFGKLDDAIPF